MADDKSPNDNNDNVRHLNLVASTPSIPEPRDAQKKAQENCVYKLEEMLAKAKQGQFLAVAFICYEGGFNFQLTWTDLVGAPVLFTGAASILESEFAKLVTRQTTGDR